MEAAQGDVRRVQKLGSSSLVVTLPKSWVKSVGLKPGDAVIVVQEGQTLRIVPAREPEEAGEGGVQLYGSTAQDAQRIIWCLYVLGPDRFEVSLPGKEAFHALREAAGRFTGMEVSAVDEKTARVSVIIDPTRFDIKGSLKGLAVDTERVVGLLRRAVMDGSVSEDDIARVREEMTRSVTLIERHLINTISVQAAGWEAKKNASMLIAANFFGLAASTMLNAAEMIVKVGKPRDSRIIKAVEELATLVPLVGVNIANPSLKRSNDLLSRLSKMREDMNTVIISTESSREDVYAATRISEIARLLTLAVSVMYCVAIRNQQT